MARATTYDDTSCCMDGVVWETCPECAGGGGRGTRCGNCNGTGVVGNHCSVHTSASSGEIVTYDTSYDGNSAYGSGYGGGYGGSSDYGQNYGSATSGR